MDILLAFIFGGAYGGVLHYLMPGRTSRGSAVAPVLGAVLGGAVWMGLTWAGLTTLDPWLWILSIAVPAVVVPAVLAILTRVRANHDARERLRLKIS
ncbi:hypothetical protein [uncultured Microbacterium sp.]|uniref:hypothetical protein n=1 Tax=uncultured Microbacterium sp. TaxID=191216 RepID=UPI0025D9A762|nr:hypothetical protein [uncultured Microbacterium sp.]